jgi:hypothetical protein
MMRQQLAVERREQSHKDLIAELLFERLGATSDEVDFSGILAFHLGTCFYELATAVDDDEFLNVVGEWKLL